MGRRQSTHNRGVHFCCPFSDTQSEPPFAGRPKGGGPVGGATRWFDRLEQIGYFNACANCGTIRPEECHPDASPTASMTQFAKKQSPQAKAAIRKNALDLASDASPTAQRRRSCRLKSSERSQAWTCCVGFAFCMASTDIAMVSSRPLGEGTRPTESIVRSRSQHIAPVVRLGRVFDGLLVTNSFCDLLVAVWDGACPLQTACRSQGAFRSLKSIQRRPGQSLAGWASCMDAFPVFEGDISVGISLSVGKRSCFPVSAIRWARGLSWDCRVDPLTLGLILALFWSSLDIFNPHLNLPSRTHWLESNLHQRLSLEMLDIRAIVGNAWAGSLSPAWMSFNCRVVAFFSSGEALHEEAVGLTSCIACNATWD